MMQTNPWLSFLSLSLSFTRFNGAQTGGSKTRKGTGGNEGEEKRRDGIKAEDPQSAKILSEGWKHVERQREGRVWNYSVWA